MLDVGIQVLLESVLNVYFDTVCLLRLYGNIFVKMFKCKYIIYFCSLK